MDLLVIGKNDIIGRSVELAPLNPLLLQILTLGFLSLITRVKPLWLVFFGQVNDELSGTFKTVEHVLVLVNFRFDLLDLVVELFEGFVLLVALYLVLFVLIVFLGFCVVVVCDELDQVNVIILKLLG